LYYDDDDNEEEGELQKVTIQIKQVVDEILEELEQKLPEPQTGAASAAYNQPTESLPQIDEFLVHFKQQATKYETEMRAMNQKLDRLTNMVTLLVGDNKRLAHLLNKSDIDGKHADGDANLKTSADNEPMQRLPSIYDLKPSMFNDFVSSQPFNDRWWIK